MGDLAPTENEQGPRQSPLLGRPSWSERKRLLRYEAWVLVVASYVAIAFAYACPQDWRNTSHAYVAAAWTAFMVRTFVYHLGLILTVVAIVAGLARVWRLFVATLPLVLLTAGPTWLTYWPTSGPQAAGWTLSIMSVNLLAVNETTGPLVREIEDAGPDVLLLQEYTDHWHDALQRSIGRAYPHVVYIPRDDSFGSAIYSKHPFREKPVRYLQMGSGTEPQMRAVVNIRGDEVALYNVHLLPPWGMEYVIETRRQFADLVDLIEDETLPVIIAGDFNFTERSPQAAALRRAGLVDAYDQAGWGRGTTWPINSFFRWIPSLRLDHIYLGGGLVAAECRTGTGPGSDHRPLAARVKVGRSRPR